MIKVYNIAPDEITIAIDGAIGEDWLTGEGNSLKSIKNQITDDVRLVNVEINSMGGDLFTAFAIYDHFRTISSKVVARITGATASAGTVIAMGADEREIMPNAKFLIHNASAETRGNAELHEKNAEALNRFDSDIIDIYRKVTGKRKSEIANLMKEEKWLSAKEAKEWGFVDRIIKEKVTNQLNDNKMEAVLNYFDVKNEAEVIAKAKAMANDVSEMKANGEQKDAEITNLKNQIDDFTKQRNEQIIAQAIEVGKITDSEKPMWLNLLQKDFESASGALKSMKTPGTVKNFLNGSNADSGLQIKTKEDAFKAFKEGKINGKEYETFTKTMEG